jgi:GNAT superfamily N-acetyltransferase
MTERWSIEPLNRAHDRTQFDCGQSTLNDWLSVRAGQFERKDLSRTFVAVEAGDQVVRGYYALATHRVMFDQLPPDAAKGLPRLDVPVVLLGRLAVDLTVQGQGLGSILLIDALRRTAQLAREIGIRAVKVDAIDDAARSFYLKFGFRPLLDDPRHLFLPMQEIRKLKFDATT